MDATELKRLETIEAQAGEVKTLQSSVNTLTDTVKNLTAQIGELTKLKTDYDALSASTAALVDAQAQLAVNEATKGIPKTLCPDEKKASLLSLYKTDRKAFDVEVGIFAAMRGKFDYLTKEVVTDESGAPVVVNASTPHKKAEPATVEVSQKAAQLRAKDPSLSIEQSIKLAAKGGN